MQREFNMLSGLEFLTEHEVELTAASATPYLVETVAPVNTEEAEHREIETHTHTGTTLEVEGGEVFNGGPTVTCLSEGESVDCGDYSCRVKLNIFSMASITCSITKGANLMGLRTYTVFQVHVI